MNLGMVCLKVKDIFSDLFSEAIIYNAHICFKNDLIYQLHAMKKLNYQETEGTYYLFATVDGNKLCPFFARNIYDS